ncbi:hypothetical protein BLNAU_245 [Blattamonas nauphoetae]|uniref:Uncharacterized protein n=1 Tax=Blattamonas nauphoetae TaxID=2049346 RepID=A0ABQ9YMG5_9EUKA|nr:hypothetical protein BLNAU_245 [Blattamonas nauphoetae]
MDAFAQFKPWRCRISAPPQQEEPIMSKEGPKLSAVERLKLAGRKKEEAAAADQPPEAPKEGKKMLLDTEEDEDEGEMQKEEEKPVDNSTTNVEQSEVIDLEKEETVNVFDERSALEWFEYAPNVEDLAAGKNTSATECMQKYLEYFGTIVTIFDANARNGLMEQQSE